MIKSLRRTVFDVNRTTVFDVNRTYGPCIYGPQKLHPVSNSQKAGAPVVWFGGVWCQKWIADSGLTRSWWTRVQRNRDALWGAQYRNDDIQNSDDRARF